MTVNICWRKELPFSPYAFAFECPAVEFSWELPLTFHYVHIPSRPAAVDPLTAVRERLADANQVCHKQVEQQVIVAVIALDYSSKEAVAAVGKLDDRCEPVVPFVAGKRQV